MAADPHAVVDSLEEFALSLPEAWVRRSVG
jgi:hypothetical protein